MRAQKSPEQSLLQAIMKWRLQIANATGTDLKGHEAKVILVQPRTQSKIAEYSNKSRYM